jgi:hypothetical protein
LADFIKQYSRRHLVAVDVRAAARLAYPPHHGLRAGCAPRGLRGVTGARWGGARPSDRQARRLQ